MPEINFATAPVNMLVNPMPPMNMVAPPKQRDEPTDMVNLIQLKDNMEQAKIRNRLQAMAMGEAELEKKQRDMVMQAYGGEEGYLQAMTQKQIKDATIAQEKKQMEVEDKIVAEQMKVFGPLFTRALDTGDMELFVQLGGIFKDNKVLGPAFETMKQQNFTITGKGESSLQTPLNDESLPIILNQVKDPLVARAITSLPIGTEVKLKTKNGFINEVEVVKPEAVTQTKLYYNSKKKLGWTDEQIYKGMKQEGIDKTQTTINIKEQASIREEERRKSEGWNGWDPELKENAVVSNLITGEKPRFAWGDKSSYTGFEKDKNQFMVDKEIAPGQLAAMRADFKANDRSLSNQKKIYDSMNGFVLNLNQQVDKVTKLMGEADRYGLKIANIPLVEVKKSIIGSGLEANIKSYLLEISSEIGKLSTGSAASIKELGEFAQKKWDLIHDPTLPIGELAKVLSTTKDQASMRLSSTKEAMDQTLKYIGGMGGPPAQTIAPSVINSPSPITQPKRNPGETIYQYKNRILQGGK